jgi:lysophospholipase L1-like esterase
MILACVSLEAAPALDDGGYILKGPQRSLAEIDSCYAEIAPIQYHPTRDRWRDLRRTGEILKHGGALRVVMLGDSIVNDTSRSSWQLVLQRSLPKATIDVTTSVRGSTGCWWYKEPGRVKRYVLDHNPDLVIIGGISQRDDIDSIREVMHQIRAASKPEFLLMTGAFGTVDPRSPDWTERPAADSYRAKLKDLAKVEHAAYLDMEAIWGRYIRDSGKELDWFKRDVVHANARGEQIVGRILVAFFTP